MRLNIHTRDPALFRSLLHFFHWFPPPVCHFYNLYSRCLLLMSTTRLSRSDHHLALCCPMKKLRFPPHNLKKPKPDHCHLEASDLSPLASPSNGQHSQEKPSTCEKALIKFTDNSASAQPQLSSCDVLEHYSGRHRSNILEFRPANHTLDEYVREDALGDMARQRVGRGRGTNS